MSKSDRITTSLGSHIHQRVMSVRHCMGRYEFSDDRKCLKFWIKAPGPCAAPYFWCNLERRSIVITLYRGDKAVAYDLRIADLENMSNWRRYVAQAIRKVRWALNAQRQSAKGKGQTND